MMPFGAKNSSKQKNTTGLSFVSPVVSPSEAPSDSLVSDTHPRPSRDPRGGAALAQVPGLRGACRETDAEETPSTGFSEETDRGTPSFDV